MPSGGEATARALKLADLDRQYRSEPLATGKLRCSYTSAPRTRRPALLRKLPWPASPSTDTRSPSARSTSVPGLVRGQAHAPRPVSRPLISVPTGMATDDAGRGLAFGLAASPLKLLALQDLAAPSSSQLGRSGGRARAAELIRLGLGGGSARVAAETLAQVRLRAGRDRVERLLEALVATFTCGGGRFQPAAASPALAMMPQTPARPCNPAAPSWSWHVRRARILVEARTRLRTARPRLRWKAESRVIAAFEALGGACGSRPSR